MADANENVVINIRVLVNDRQLDRLQRKLAAIVAQSKAADAAMADFGSKIDKVVPSMDRFGSSTGNADRSLSRMGTNMARRMTPSMSRFGKSLVGLTGALAKFNKISLIVFGVSLAAAALSLASVNALFATGRFLVKAYQVSLQALAVTTASVGAVLATVAAAMREYNAAAYAYSYKTSPAFTTKTDASRAALRMLHDDAQLAVFGFTALNGAFATLSRSGQVTGQTVGLLRATADFAAAGGDVANNFQKAAEFVAVVQKDGKLTAESLALASEISPTFAKGLSEAAKLGIKSHDQIMEALKSGQLAQLAGVDGQAQAIGETLVGTGKRYLQGLINLFTDMGQSLIKPAGEAMDRIFWIVKGGIMKIAPEIVGFGSSGMLDGLVSGIQKIVNWFVDITQRWLPEAIGMTKRFAAWWERVVGWFNKTADALRPLLDGGSRVIGFFRDLFGEIFGKIGLFITTLDRLLVENEDEWRRFGDALVNAFSVAGDFLVHMMEMFDKALPVITPIVEAFVAIAEAILSASKGLAQMTGSLGAFAQVFGFSLLGLAVRNFAKGKGFSPMPGGRGQGGAGASSGLTVIGGAGQGGGPASSSAFRGRFRGMLGGGRATSMLGLGMLLGAPFLMENMEEGSQGGVGLGLTIAGAGTMMGAGKYALPLGGLIAGQSIAANATTSGGAILGGAIAGGSTGAAVGSLIPIPGGTAIGAAVGAIIGAFTASQFHVRDSRRNATMAQAQREMNKLDAQTFEGFVTGNFDPLEAAFSEMAQRNVNLQRIVDENLRRSDGMGSTVTVGDLSVSEHLTKWIEPSFWIDSVRDLFGDLPPGPRAQTLNNLMEQGLLNADEVAGLAGNPDLYISQRRAELEDRSRAFLRGIGDSPVAAIDRATFSSQLAERGYIDVVGHARRLQEDLAKATGRSEEEIVQLATTMGVRLHDQTLSLADALEQLGMTTGLVGKQINDAVRNILVDGITTGWDNFRARRDAPNVRTELSQGIAGLVRSGTATMEDREDYFLDYLVQGLLEHPDHPMGIMQDMNEFFGPGGIMYQEGRALYGMEDSFIPVFQQMFPELLNIVRPQINEMLASSMVERFALEGKVLGQDEALRLVSGLDLQGLNALENALTENTLIPTADNRGIPDVGRSQFGVIFPGAAMPLDTASKPLAADDPLAKMDADNPFLQELNGAITNFSASLQAEMPWENAPLWFSTLRPSFYNQYPVWWSPTLGGEDDTPTARYAATMARHRSLDSALAGSRTITSGYRTNRLGSINSDHITGSAYDLIGQNLGAYSQLVRNTGGFAEFHGTGGDRHLHVVPGAGPVGDTMSPIPVAAPSASPSSSVNNYSINVNGANASADEIARKVMRQIQRVARSSKERA